MATAMIATAMMTMMAINMKVGKPSIPAATVVVGVGVGLGFGGLGGLGFGGFGGLGGLVGLVVSVDGLPLIVVV